jgi:glucosamine kinase
MRPSRCGDASCRCRRPGRAADRRDAAEQIDDLVRRLSEHGASRIALLGGLASSMQPWLAPDVQRRLVPVEGDAVDGALHLARRAANKKS